ncbi:hypothetical protein [Bacillus sp. T33-2]|uniref:hypothetical protein n=1 Tax=Bacillus sp. T33-2 TaxID=2054168 RepID=UPI0015E09773|nr:hypothetical protein [Bacillus sp. T33-2]
MIGSEPGDVFLLEGIAQSPEIMPAEAMSSRHHTSVMRKAQLPIVPHNKWPVVIYILSMPLQA